MDLKDMASLTLQTLIPSYKRNLGSSVAMYGIIIEQRFAWLTKNLKQEAIVIDIGAYIGETAIYFASFDKIKIVYAYEPFPSLYKRAIKNAKISGLSKKIKLFNMGVSDKDQIYKIKNEGDLGSEFMDSGSGTEIKSISLNTILKDKKYVIIKSNSEGSEHKIFTKAVNLDNVQRIHIAYHYGMQKLPEILKSKGFEIKIWEEGTDVSKGQVGTIYARRD